MPRILSEVSAGWLCSDELCFCCTCRGGHFACFLSLPCHSEANGGSSEHSIQILSWLFALFYLLPALPASVDIKGRPHVSREFTSVTFRPTDHIPEARVCPTPMRMPECWPRFRNHYSLTAMVISFCLDRSLCPLFNICSHGNGNSLLRYFSFWSRSDSTSRFENFMPSAVYYAQMGPNTFCRVTVVLPPLTLRTPADSENQRTL